MSLHSNTSGEANATVGRIIRGIVLFKELLANDEVDVGSTASTCKDTRSHLEVCLRYIKQQKLTITDPAVVAGSKTVIGAVG